MIPLGFSRNRSLCVGKRQIWFLSGMKEEKNFKKFQDRSIKIPLGFSRNSSLSVTKMPDLVSLHRKKKKIMKAEEKCRICFLSGMKKSRILRNFTIDQDSSRLLQKQLSLCNKNARFGFSSLKEEEEDFESRRETPDSFFSPLKEQNKIFKKKKKNFRRILEDF
jgi:hypothetical protein